ncbi:MULTISPECIES: TIGR04222 domain-containing membrane protein [Streptomyces]|uniref:Domain protein n=1 Tax=Streptomyces chartreusis NRRL 3882 TaxID=1079985 RepID=A0A2N9B473_STRCX|nr:MULTISPECIES: TIGR04222 domain-containing membrane protein [Streptomyces]MYS88937.1 TIGR04222 domain-containing membrane protein [Streptomyces sp. SID5464]SOR78118.1 domain protein [Streptomyces chartreusis NRRL 3882]
MSDGTAVPLEPHEIALLGDGPRAAVTVAVVDLYLRGLVEADRPGTMRRGIADAVTGERPPSPLAEAVHGALRRPAGLRTLVKNPDIRLAVALMRIPLAEAGLLRYPLLGPTRAARRHVRELRLDHPLPASRRGLTDHDRLLAVALHGEAALRLLVPRFALRAGLMRRAEVGGKPLLKHSPRGTGGGSAGYSYCGGGGGGGGE